MSQIMSTALSRQESGGSAITNLIAKAQASSQLFAEQQSGSPSPTTILKTVNSSGHYLCSQHKEMPSPKAKYHEPSGNCRQVTHQNMMQHRNNSNELRQQEHRNQFECDESYDSSIQDHHRQQPFPQYSYSQIQHSAVNETQQEADQQTIELKMNNLGNENAGC